MSISNLQPPNPLAADLDFILDRTPQVWPELRGQSIFMTGGTGFFGRWLLESFAWANARHKLGARLLVLSRDPAAFARRAPHLTADGAIEFITGDVRDFAFPDGRFSHILHVATDSTSTLWRDDPLALYGSIADGTHRVLEFARHCGAAKFLFTSSGAVYGKQDPSVELLTEDYGGGPDPCNVTSAYAEGKRTAEFLCASYAARHGIEAKIARGFAFVGPHLPIDIHFAIGNFVRDALSSQSIHISGDGRPYRSYLYAADMAAWLWTMLVAGRSGAAYNLGSDQAFSIEQVARAVAAACDPPPAIVVAGAPGSGPPPRYVPSIERARRELGLDVWTALPQSIERTLRWHRAVKSSNVL